MDKTLLINKGTQGLKFQATFDESTLELERGFFVIYGKASIEDLMEVVDDENPTINGKSVKIANQYDNTSPILSVVLTGIPISGYNQDITVIGYVKNGNDYEFVPQ